MEKNNPLYKNQGIHVITTIWTVEKGVTKVLLLKRSNEPFKNMWALVGGALYNNEDLITGAKREIFEKTGIADIDLTLVDVFGDVERSPIMRMIAISYVGILDSKKVSVLKKTLKTEDAEWFPIDDIPELAYDHNIIIKKSLEKLKQLILKTDILKALFPEGWTLPEMQKVYEAILNKTFDRRNFRKKLLSLDLIEDTGKEVKFEGRKPAKLYRFKKKSNIESIF